MTIGPIHASKVDLFLACNQSLRGDLATEPDFAEAATAMGTAVHAVLEQWIMHHKHAVLEQWGMHHKPSGPTRMIGDIAPRVAEGHGVDLAELESLCQRTLNACAHIREPLWGARHAELRAEARIKTKLVSARLDHLRIGWGHDRDGNRTGPFSIAVLDWKTGRELRAKPGQLYAYASAACVAAGGFPSQGWVYTGEIWCRHDQVIQRKITAERLAAFEDKLKRALDRPSDTYKPGAHCGFCPRADTCEARVARLKSTADALGGLPALPDAKTIAPADLARLYDKAQDLGRLLDQYYKILNAAIEQHGPIDVGDGSRLELREMTKTEIDAKAAWRHLRQAGLSDEEINDVLSVAKGKLERAVKAKHPRGKKESAWSELFGVLRAADAIRESSYRKRERIHA